MRSEISDDQPGLFGWVPAPARGQGRPAFTWSREKSNKLMLLFASGYTFKTAAQVIGCDIKTLKKVFPIECRERDRAELVVRTGMMARLAQEAEAGNVAASKALDHMLQRERAIVINGTIGKPGPKPKARAVQKGKKEAAKEAAQGVGGRFGTRAPPPLMQ